MAKFKVCGISRKENKIIWEYIEAQNYKETYEICHAKNLNALQIDEVNE